MTTTLTMQGIGLADIQAALEELRGDIATHVREESIAYQEARDCIEQLSRYLANAHEHRTTFLRGQMDQITALIGADNAAMRMAAE